LDPQVLSNSQCSKTENAFQLQEKFAINVEVTLDVHTLIEAAALFLINILLTEKGSGNQQLHCCTRCKNPPTSWEDTSIELVEIFMQPKVLQTKITATMQKLISQ
jgi:hypothetical protein